MDNSLTKPQNKNKLFDIQQKCKKEKEKRKRKTPGKIFRGFRCYVVAVVVAVAMVVAWLH